MRNIFEKLIKNNNIKSIAMELDNILSNVDLKIKLDKKKSSDIIFYKSEMSAGFSISTVDEAWFEPGESKLLGTGISIEIPEGYFLAIVPIDSNNMNSPLRLTNSFGVIDSDYQGELKIMYTNTSSEKYFVRFPTRLSKGILIPFVRARFIFDSE